MVKKYTDLIVEMFVSEYTPEQVCAKLKLCNPATPTQLLSNDINQDFGGQEVEVEELEVRVMLVVYWDS